MFKQKIIAILAEKTKLSSDEIESLLETPPSLELGDYAFPCFILSKKYKKSPDEIAKDLLKSILKGSSIKETFGVFNKEDFEKIEANRAYLNFFINKGKLAEEILKINSNYGKQNIGKKKKIVIDFSAPNIGKPMHIGHIRSTILGDSLMRVYNFLNYDVIGVNYLGDVGLHIGKLIVAYELWLDKKSLEKNPVDELLRLYVKFCSKEKSRVTEGLDEEFQENEWTNRAKEKIKLLELGDKKTHEIWNEIRKASEKSFNRVYDMLNISFSETVGQSSFTKKGKEIITEAILKKHAKAEPDGAVFIESFGKKKYILRANQTASYITQDIGAAVERFNKYKFHKMIYVTDFRQKEHFEHLFNILSMFNYEWSDRLIHLPFGTINFGKEIIASRTGNIIHLEEVLRKTIEKAKKEIKKRNTKGDPEKIGVSALKYIVLKNEPIKDVNFSWEHALNFEGNTGPYLQYAYARASSILKKAKKQNFNKGKVKIGSLTKEEIVLLSQISKFPEIVEKAGKLMSPSLIANYSYELASSFNEFYHKCHVLNDKNEAFRLRLLESFRTTLKNSLALLGIEVMEEM